VAFRRLAAQTALHVFARLASSACSFLLFSLIARKLPDEQTQRAFFFLFSLGFGLATLRLFAQLAAAMDGHARSTVRLRQARLGLLFVVRTLPIAVPLLGAIAGIHTRDPLTVAIACIIACLAALDIDLLRAVVHRAPTFSTTFAFGTLVSLIGLYLHPNPGFGAVCLWMLVQWIPTAVLNIACLARLRHRASHGSRGAPRVLPPTHLGSLLLLAVFDGAILNAPFLGWFVPTPQVGVDLSLAMRMFVASLPMQPLLLHWANSPALAGLAAKMGVGLALAFSLMLSASGIVAGTAFMLLYVFVSGKQAGVGVFTLYVMLLASYCLYAAQMRLSAPKLAGHQRLLTLAALLLVYGAAFCLNVQGLQHSALKIGLLQSLTLVGCALAFNRLSRHN
jgi:hypothetical protein